MSERMDDAMVDGVAIIGMAGRFPGAANVDEFWQNLIAGKDTITRFSAAELEARDSSAVERSADYVMARGVLDDVAMFDAEYFGISPREAERMDPQHRIFLEACSNALEDGGYVSADYAGDIGLFAGCSLNTYLMANLAGDRGFLEELTGQYQVGEFQTALGNDKDFLTTRAAYKLNLRGPCVSVQSACATSLVAVCQASQALMNFQCDMALAGGVSATFPQHRGHVYQEGGITSRDGHCRPFDAQATGTVFGHGVGVVLLKRLEDAVRDGDQIAGVIRGFAVNNDGAAKAGYMAPGVDGQARVIAAAQAMAGVSAETISYVEAHGTGTPLGDPIELAALTRTFRADTEREHFCAVGTAKGNVGHLDSAAGVTGVIKAALSLRHRTLPGLAHFERANPNLDLAGSPFYFNAKTAAWTSDGPLRAGVSAFGVGGVNAHVVIEEAPASTATEKAGGARVLCVSGRTPAAAKRAAGNLAGYLEGHPGVDLGDVSYTMAVGRRAHAYRLAVAASGAGEDAARLAQAGLSSEVEHVQGRSVAFLFSGQGTQFAGMGKALYAHEAVYREVVDECAEAAKDALGFDLRELIFAGDEDGAASERLRQTRNAQPALFVTELALARLWQAWGIAPKAMVGHSLGEYVAATMAGVFDWRDALKLVCLRGKLMDTMPVGAMLSVALGEEDLAPYLDDQITVSALNAARASVLGGEVAAIERLEARLTRDGVAARRLRTSHAFHSPMMQPMLAEFEAAVSKVARKAPTSAFVSSVTGTWITAEQAMSAVYWSQQCRQPVLFGAAVDCLMADGCDVLLEVGPGETLTKLAMQQARGAARTGVRALASLTDGRNGTPGRTPCDALAGLWNLGVEIDWDGVFEGAPRRRISLPTYPFERTLHWVEPPARAVAENTLNADGVSVDAMTLDVPPVVSVTEPVSRIASIRAAVAEVFTELSGIVTTPEEADCQFLELGFDSLFLTQAILSLQKKFGVKITFRQLMEQLSSIASLADHLDTVLPAEAFTAAKTVAPSVVAASAMAATGGSALEQMMADQLAAMTKMFTEQVASLRAVAGGAVPVLTVAATPEVRHGSFRPIQAKTQHEVTTQQQNYIDALIAKYETKTAGSKRLTQGARGHLADPRAVAGFRAQWKEMVYPLLTERARGSKLWDVDGNEYIDIVNGYGCIMFGHSPQFVVDAVRDQLDRGVAIGPQSPLAGEVAALLCELTGNERVTFCNTGSEAVMAAIRVARTVTGRDKVVYFGGDYHGTFDEVLVRQTPRGSAPVAPGIPMTNVTNVVVLEYGSDESLAYLRSHATEIAAVMIEPVQTRNPGLQPFEFIREARRITEQNGAALILDEVVTGFRLAPGGVQEMLGIRADMCTYGKVIGGGHPIGVLSGKAEYLDALDGGAWQFGDDSGPEVGVTFFAGTFVRHPLALAAARAVLTHLKKQGPELQRELNRKTARLAESLDRFFVERGVPSRVHHFCSWFYFTFPHDARFGSLLYYAMRAKGIHIQEGYPCFLTTAHTEADLAAVEAAFRETILEMQAGGVLSSTQLEPVSGMHEKALAVTPARVPLTEPQREVFLAAALNEEANCAFNESLSMELRGDLRISDLTAALDTVLARHDALRSTVSEDGDWLDVAPKATLKVDVVDLAGLLAAPQTDTLERATAQEARTPFDLHHGPLVRATLFHRSSKAATLLLTAHHLVLDGWSANQMLEEVGKIYSGHGAELAPLLPFSSYAVLERQRERAGDFDANEEYWVEKFRDRAPRLELPVDRPRTMVKSYRGDTLSGQLGRDLYTELKKASARAGCSLYVTLLSGFELMLHRLSGQTEVVVGISTAGQTSYSDASLVGHCVHFLPMLSEISDGLTAREHLRATKTALLDAYDHQEFTYGSLLRKLKIAREPGRLPLIEVQFNLERVGANVAFAGLDVSVKANAKQFVNTDLFLNVMETANDLEFACDYNSELLDTATVARWMANWAELLRNQAAAPEERCDDRRMMTASEETALLANSSGPTMDFGEFEPVTASLLRRAGDDPERIALECGATRWSYSALYERAAMLAKRLRAEGLEPGGLVGIAVERSPEMLCAMLATWLAGGAYVPLDPRHPQERIEAVLANAGVTLLLTTDDLRLKTSAKVLNMRATVDVAGVKDFVPAVLRAESLAYVIYTSGSTGVPKGVAVEHGALMNLLRSMEREPGLSAGDTLVAVTTLAFDIAALELLLPLLVGARLVIATDDEVRDGMKLLQLLQRVRTTVLQATPGAWRLLIDAGWARADEAGALPLKALCGGEALPRELANKLLEHAGEVWNVYGPTETTIWSSATRVRHEKGAPRLGTPIANTQFYVFDERRHLAPFGVAGELFIAGAGLARGYWKRPELTAEKFIANPLGEGRAYATGDLARRLADGTIELLGRTDFQVKIRGYRIELAEIEATLTKHPQVHEAVVIKEEAGSGSLIGYVATGFDGTDGSATTLVEELPTLLGQTLPDYMVPAKFIVMSALPRTANGKIDRKALPAAVPSGSDDAGTLARTFTPPSTPMQRLLAGIWADVMELNQVSITDSIFELGADSLVIFRIAARAQREGLAVTATQIFQLRTIARLCEKLAEPQAATPVRVTTRIAAAARNTYRVPSMKVDA